MKLRNIQNLTPRSIRSGSAGRLKRAFGELAWIAIGQLVSVLGSMVLVRVLTELLEPAEYGRLSLSLTITGLVNQIILGGLANGIVRYYPAAKESGNMGGFWRAALGLTVQACAGVLAVALLAALVLSMFRKEAAFAPMLAASLYALITGINSVLLGLQNAARNRANAALYASADSWLRVGMATAFVFMFGPHSYVAIAAYAAAALLVVCAQGVAVHRHISGSGALGVSSDSRRWRSDIIRFARPFCLWGPFTWAHQSSDRWALGTFVSTVDAGLYTAAFQLGYSPIGMLSSAIMTFLQPILNQKSGTGTDEARNREVHRVTWLLAYVSLSVTFLASAIAGITHEQIFRLLVAPPYRASSSLLPWMVLAGGLFASGQLLSGKLSAELRPEDMTRMKIVTAVIGLGSNLLGAHLYGARGVAGALVVFSTVFFCWMAILAHKLHVAKR